MGASVKMEEGLQPRIGRTRRNSMDMGVSQKVDCREQSQNGGRKCKNSINEKKLDETFEYEMEIKTIVV